MQTLTTRDRESTTRTTFTSYLGKISLTKLLLNQPAKLSLTFKVQNCN